MKTIQPFLILSICLLCFGHFSNASAQTQQELESKIQQINTDLKENQMKYSWLLTEDYINYCTTFEKLIDITKEDYLRTLIYDKKPEGIKNEAEAYQKAKDTLIEYLRKFKEYQEVENLKKNARTEAQRKDASAAMSTVFNSLWNENDNVKELRAKESATLKALRIAALRYMLNEYKKLNWIMPTNTIDYQIKNNLQKNNTELGRLSRQANLLESIQRELERKCERMKYNILEEKIN